VYYVNLIKNILLGMSALVKIDDTLVNEILDNMGEYRLSAMTHNEIVKAVKNTLIALGY
jgi:hypothetical protein